MTQFKNTVGKAIGVIVINNASKNKAYNPGNFKDPKLNNRMHALSVEQEIEATMSMFRDLKIDANVRTIEDKSKKEIIKEFERLHSEAIEFDSHHTD